MQCFRISEIWKMEVAYGPESTSINQLHNTKYFNGSQNQIVADQLADLTTHWPLKVVPFIAPQTIK